MGAMLATVDAAAGFEPGAHATTFGGGAVLSAVASAVLDALQENSLPQRAAELGARALERFREVQAKHPDKVAEVRGRGLMLGIELTGPAQPAWRALLDRGFVLNVAQERVLRLLPALTIEWEDLENFARALDEVLALA
jgi:acetylornithine aminotransferase